MKKIIVLALFPLFALHGGLKVVNGDFSDLTGMNEGVDKWYAGALPGWTCPSATYAVQNKPREGTTPPICNPSDIGNLRQTLGVLEKTSDVKISFDVSSHWRADPLLKVSLLTPDFLELASGSFKPGDKQSLTARFVPAGTTVILAFQALNSTPGLDNVSVSVEEGKDVANAEPDKVRDDITVACYYFGNYHPNDSRNRKQKGEGWSEWELVKAAKPRFPGHAQPKVPLWGYVDESDPAVMAKKIDAAADHGIDAFIFDWYYYNDGPFLEKPIDEGFMKAKNNDRLKFAFMWANHDWVDIHPYKRGTPCALLYPGMVSQETFRKINTMLITKYFKHPSYWRIDGKPYFSYYDLTRLLGSFGSVAATRKALDDFRAEAKKAGFAGLHLNAVVWGRAILPSENKPADAAKLIKDLGFDSVTSYVWIHHVGLPALQTDYNEVRNSYMQYWNDAMSRFDVPYYPNVTMGWDSSPRAFQTDKFENVGYPFMNTMGNNTPENFKEALAMTKRRLLANPDGPRIFNINCWNEWTEGSYLEPDKTHGYKYLEAVQSVFGSN